MKNIVIIPCYNEEKRLNPIPFIEYVKNNADCFFLFVNDGSKDQTLEVLKRITAESNSMGYLNLPENKGKAEAIREGFLYSIRHFSVENIGFWDADLATPLDEIVNFASLLDNSNYNLITGLRLSRLGANIKRKTSRHHIGRIFATFVSLLFKIPVYDSQCGAKMYKCELIEPLFSKPFITRWLFDVELLARYIELYGQDKAIKNIYEYPIKQWEDVGGSSLKMKDFLKAPWELFKIWRAY